MLVSFYSSNSRVTPVPTCNQMALSKNTVSKSFHQNCDHCSEAGHPQPENCCLLFSRHASHPCRILGIVEELDNGAALHPYNKSKNQREGNRYHCRFRGGTDIPRVFGSGNQYHRETLFTVTAVCPHSNHANILGATRVCGLETRITAKLCCSLASQRVVECCHGL